MKTHLHSLISCLLLLTFLAGCKKEEQPTTATPPPPEPPRDTNWVTHAQVDIPWPSLAASPWPMLLHDPQHTGRSPYRGPQEGRVEWLFNAGSAVYSSPAIDEDGSVYFGSDNRYFFAITPSGSERWRSEGGGSRSSPLIASDGSIYIYGSGTQAGYPSLLCYDRAGNIKWEYVVGVMKAFSSPTIAKDGETIYVSAGYLYAITKDGTLRWKVLPSDSTDQGFQYSPAFSPDGTTLYAPGSHALFAIDTSGVVKWSVPSGLLTSNPAVDNDGNIYVAGGGVSLFSLSPSGSLRWRRDDVDWGQESPGPVIGKDGTIYIAGGNLYAFDYAGKLRWKYAMSRFSQGTPAIDIEGTLYLGTLTDRTPADSVNFLALNSNGTLKYQVSLRSPDGTVPDVDSFPAISSDGKIYAGSDRPRGFHVYKVR